MRVMSLLFALAFCYGPVSAQDFGPIVENMYRNAIVKIEVSSNTPVFDGTRNRCLSEGTGFLVNKSHVVTANHVLAIPSECGSPVILVKSRPKYKLQMAGKVLGQQDDIALLEIPPVDQLCSLVLSLRNAFSTSAFRYFMPKGIDEPEPVKATVGDGDGPYKPLVSLTGSDAFPGDSGGPVIHYFNVIGMLKARHETYNNLNFMITADRVIAILNKFGIARDGSECNPAMYSAAYTSAPDQVIFVVPPNSALPAQVTAAAMKDVSQKIAQYGTPMLTEAHPLYPPLSAGNQNNNWFSQFPPKSPLDSGNVGQPGKDNSPRTIIAGYSLPGYPGLVAKPHEAFGSVELDLKAVPEQFKITAIQQFGTQLDRQIVSFYWDAVMNNILATRPRQ